MTRIAVLTMVVLAVLGCTGEGEKNAAKREMDRIMLRMDDLETRNAKLLARVEELEKENTELRKQRDAAQGK